MKVWAQIRYEKIRIIKRKEIKPIGPDWHDITDFNPLPKVGDYVNLVNKTIITKPDIKNELRFLTKADCLQLRDGPVTVDLVGKGILEILWQLIKEDFTQI